MPTREEREYYRAGYQDGLKDARRDIGPDLGLLRHRTADQLKPRKRQLSAWNKYVRANSKKSRFRYRNGKLNLKKMAIAFRKTPAGKKKRR